MQHKVTTVAELEHDEHEGLDEASLLEHEEITKVKNVANVLFGKYIMECWYFSPFPKVSLYTVYCIVCSYVRAVLPLSLYTVQCARTYVLFCLYHCILCSVLVRTCLFAVIIVYKVLPHNFLTLFCTF